MLVRGLYSLLFSFLLREQQGQRVLLLQHLLQEVQQQQQQQQQQQALRLTRDTSSKTEISFARLQLFSGFIIY